MSEEKKSIVDKVKFALDEVRPYLKIDGGDVKLLEVTDDMVVKIELLGSCTLCPMSETTLHAGVAQSIKRYVPEIVEIKAFDQSVSLI